jgi:lipopolysaccharide exporter
MRKSNASKAPRRTLQLRRFFDPGTHLAARTANAGVWAFALSIAQRLLSFVRTVVLARLLAPDDFGLMAIALIALTLLETFTRTGFEQALIQRKGDITGHLDSAWTISLIRGVVLGTALFLGAPLVGQFFGTPEAIPLVQALAVVSVLSGLKNTGVVFFDKELQFRERFLYRSFPILVEAVVSIGLALVLQNVWSLVLGKIASLAATVIASFVAHPYRPRLRLESAKVKDLFGFGVWITVASIVLYFVENLDNIAVGRLLSAAELGLYKMAFTISALLWMEITWVVDQVVFPALSKIQSSTAKMREGFLGTLELVSAAVFPVTVGLWFVGPAAVAVLLGENWLGLLPAYGALLIRGLLRSIGGTTAPLFRSMGKPRITTAFFLATLVVMLALIFPFTATWGIAGTAWATVISSIPIIGSIFLAGRMLQTGWMHLVRPIVFPAGLSVVMLGALAGAREVLPGGVWLLVWAPLLGGAVFVGLLMASRRLWDYRPGDALFSRLRGDRSVEASQYPTESAAETFEDLDTTP